MARVFDIDPDACPECLESLGSTKALDRIHDAVLVGEPPLAYAEILRILAETGRPTHTEG